ncbi:MAG: tyrosine-type recombinase/integrase [Mucilaginibacter sp.]
MATVAIVLNTTYKLSNGEYAVALRVTYERRPKYYALSTLITNQSLSFQCNPTVWRPAQSEDNGLGRFRKTFKGYKDCNAVLEAKLIEAQKILQRYDSDGIVFSFEQFETDLKHKEKPTIALLDEYYAQQIVILQEQKRIGLAGLCYEVKRILAMFKPRALLKDVNVRFLESFEYWLRHERNNKDTTISVKMRNLQGIINKAIEDKLLKPQDYPFGEKKYSINKRLDHSTRKIAIHTDKIAKLKALNLEPGSSLHFAQQICLFSYYCRGMNFIDMAYLKWSDISETHIEYVRKKTGGRFHIPINQHNKPILNYFKTTHTDNHGYVFPIINPTIHITLQQQYTRKKTALSAVNYNLKKLAKMINEPKLKLSTNVLRHSYATGLKRAGVNTSYITEALGHATQEQTQTYLDGFEEGVIEGLESKLFES